MSSSNCCFLTGIQVSQEVILHLRKIFCKQNQCPKKQKTNVQISQKKKTTVGINMGIQGTWAVSSHRKRDFTAVQGPQRSPIPLGLEGFLSGIESYPLIVLCQILSSQATAFLPALTGVTLLSTSSTSPANQWRTVSSSTHGHFGGGGGVFVLFFNVADSP